MPSVTAAARSTIERILEAPISIVAAAKKNRIDICSKTAIRWAVHGVRGRKLPTLKIAGRRLTSVAVMREWLLAIQPQDPAPVDRAIDSDGARKVLEGFGYRKGSKPKRGKRGSAA